MAERTMSSVLNNCTNYFCKCFAVLLERYENHHFAFQKRTMDCSIILSSSVLHQEEKRLQDHYNIPTLGWLGITKLNSAVAQ